MYKLHTLSLWKHLIPSKLQWFSTICSLWTTHQIILHDFTSGGPKVAPHNVVPQGIVVLRGTAWCIICRFVALFCVKLQYEKCVHFCVVSAFFTESSVPTRLQWDGTYLCMASVASRFDAVPDVWQVSRAYRGCYSFIHSQMYNIIHYNHVIDTPLLWQHWTTDGTQYSGLSL